MLLAIDVGNTNITYGVFDGTKLKASFRTRSETSRTSDERGSGIRELLHLNNIEVEKIDGAIIASVVPNVMHSLNSAIRKYLNLTPMIVGPGIKTGIKIRTDNPREVGADRIVDAVGAFTKYGGPVLVLDFGTGTTYDFVNEKGELLAGVIAPGVGISARALWEGAAKLPEIEIADPGSVLATNTVTAMQAGLVYGQIGQTEYIINRMKSETGISDLKVVATGGYASVVASGTKSIDVIDSELTLDGLRIIYEKNQNRKS